MSRLILAICPSNQSQNPVAGGGNERDHIAPLAETILVEAGYRASITARVFHAQPESEDFPVGSLCGLIAQQKAAAAWIAGLMKPGDLTVSLNLHSDSGTERHCGFYFDGEGTVSEWLGRALADSIKGRFGGTVYSADYSGYIFARELHFTAAPVLLECGAHTQREDVAAVRDHPGEIARDLIACLVGFFGLETAPPLNLSELRTFGEWQLGRCANGEDPRYLPAFRKHLAALGCDAGDVRRYGVPC